MARTQLGGWMEGIFFKQFWVVGVKYNLKKIKPHRYPMLCMLTFFNTIIIYLKTESVNNINPEEIN